MGKNNLKTLRQLCELSQSELSDKLQSKPGKTVISLIENGHVMPTWKLLEELCRFFNVDPEDIFEMSDLFANVVEPHGLVNIVVTDEMVNAIKELSYEDANAWFNEAKRKLMREIETKRVSDMIDSSDS